MGRNIDAGGGTEDAGAGGAIDAGAGIVDKAGGTNDAGAGAAIDTAGGTNDTGAGGAIEAGDLVDTAGGTNDAGAGGAIDGDEGAITAGGRTVDAGAGDAIAAVTIGSGSALHAGGATEAAASSQPRSISVSVFAGGRTGVGSISTSNVGTFGGVNASGGVAIFAVIGCGPALFGATLLGGAGGTLVARGGTGDLRAAGAAGGPLLIGFTAIPTMSESSRMSVAMRSRAGGAEVLISEGPEAGAGGAVDVEAAGGADVRGRGIDGRTLALMPRERASRVPGRPSGGLRQIPARSPFHYTSRPLGCGYVPGSRRLTERSTRPMH